jgi:hypothetical protein
MTFSESRCGIWSGSGGLVAALINTEGRRVPYRVPGGDEARWDWLHHLQGEQGLDLELVLPESLGRTDPIGQLALAREIPLWLAPDGLVKAIRDAARLNGLAAAAMLARLPACKAWRYHLRRVVALRDPRQLPLL